jgi:hypothetical protein
MDVVKLCGMLRRQTLVVDTGMANSYSVKC